MQRNEDEKRDNGKDEGGRNEPALATGDIVSEENNPPISGDGSSGSNPVINPEGGVPFAATASFQGAENSASGGIQLLNTEPRTELVGGQDLKISNSSKLKMNLKLDLESQTPRLSVPLLEDETSPLIAPEQPPASSMGPLTIPLVAVDGSRCRRQSTSEESLKSHLHEVKKVDNLEVNVSPGKRKTRTSSTSNKYDSDYSSSSESSADRKEYHEKPRQKKSLTSRIFKMPSKNRDKSPSDTTAKRDKSPKDSRSKRDKSPSYSQTKRDKSPTYPHGKRDKSPKDSLARAKSPSKLAEMYKHTKEFFSKHDDEESKPLCEIEGGSPQKVVKESKPAYTYWKGMKIPDGFYLEKDVHSSETTCDSPSTRFSMASISTDSPISEAGNAIGENTPEAPENPHRGSPNQESPNPKDDDREMDEN